MESYLRQGYCIEIWKKDWGAGKSHEGTRYDKKRKCYSKSSGAYLFDPKTHPEDFFTNLVLSTFKNITYIDKGDERYNSNWFFRLKRDFYFLFRSNYISFPVALCLLSNRETKHRYYKQKLYENFLIHPTKKNFLNHILFILRTKVFINLKVKPKKFFGIKYKLSKNLNTNKLNQFIYNAGRKKYILISVLWDENKKFEVMDDRLKGGPIYTDHHNNNFDNLINYVKKLDSILLKRKDYKFLLASKKAVDWENIIESDFLDLRTFEEFGFCLSQMIFICQELSVATINWPSTFSIWITPCRDIIHLTWNDNKDSARISWNKLHLEEPETLMELLDNKYEGTFSKQ